MFENVIIGVDGRPAGRDAVALAHRLASPEARVTIAYVYGEVEASPAITRLPDEQRSAARRLVEQERDAGWPGADAVSVYAASAGRGLHELADHRHADLLVVGSSGHSVLGKILLGDDARAAFNGAPCALAIAPRGLGVSDTPIRMIGVGYDGEPESARALATAKALGARLNATVRATWVMTLQDVRNLAPLPADWDAASATVVGHAQARLDEMDGIEGHAVYGGPREELTKLSLEVDLLVVGSRGYGPLGSIFHGSVSSYLERHAASALLVLPRDHVTEPPRATRRSTEKPQRSLSRDR
ncbi:MAG: universal stress protein [Solirubrobacteraceae bacterium]